MFWLLIDVFRSPDFLQRVREEAAECLLEYTEGDIPRFDVGLLVRQPFLQAAYAEALRLRTHGVITRHPRQAIVVNGWCVQAGSYVVNSSTIAHMDQEVWSSEERGSHPVEVFAPERFLTASGEDFKKTFSLAGLEGSWIPFAGGMWACPGRIFAKQQTIHMLAALTTMYDIEMIAREVDLEMSTKRFGFGVLEPKGKSPFRIRQRAAVAAQ